MNSGTSRMAATLAATFICSAAVQAQNAATQGPPAANELQEVVVTAQKRTESAQTTPISMGIFSAADLVKDGITDVQTLSMHDTSLNFSNGGSTEGWITMRGISSHDVTEVGDPTVPIANDGFFVNRSYAMVTSLYDLERVEVLRGPQGTLYGRNASGGVVNIISAKPTDQLEATGSVEAGNFNELHFDGMVNIPLSDSVQLRAAYDSLKHDGYRQVQPGLGLAPDGGDDADAQSGRAELAFSPIEHFHGLVTIQAAQIGGVGAVNKQIPFANNPAIPGDILHSKPDLGDPNNFDGYSPTYVRVDEKTYKIQLVYDDLPAGITATYLGGYDNLAWRHSLPLNGFLGFPFTTPLIFSQNEFPKTVNHEFRLTSAADQLITWQAGVFFFEERNTDVDDHAVVNPGAVNAATLIHFHFPLVEDVSRAAYGQGTLRLTDTLKLTGGARYTSDAKDRFGTFDINAAGQFGIPQYGAARFTKTTGHVSLEWTPTNQTFEYAKVDTGYKAGGFTTCNPYGPETVTAYEVGSKNRFLNNSMQFNVAGFYNNYKDQQIQTFVPASVCVSDSTVQNAGGSHIYGAEASFDALLDPIGRADLALTYLHARFTDFVAAPGLPAAVADCAATTPGGNCQLAGNTLSNSPTWTIAAGFEHGWKLPNLMTMTGRVEARYQSLQYFDPFNYASTTQGAYTVANASLDFTRDRWKVGAWVRNFTNKDYLVYAAEFYTNSVYRYSFGAPRTYGVTVAVSLN